MSVTAILVVGNRAVSASTGGDFAPGEERGHERGKDDGSRDEPSIDVGHRGLGLLSHTCFRLPARAWRRHKRKV